MRRRDMDPDDLYEQSREGVISEEEAEATREAVRKLKSPAEIIDTALNAASYYARKLAARRIEDENAIVDILLKTQDHHIIDSLLSRIKNQETLERLVKTANDYYVQSGALDRINDQSLLIDIARGNGDASIRSEAAKRIADPAVLLDLLKDETSLVRWSAIRAETDQRLLEEILKNDGDSYIRMRAAEYVKNKEILKEAAACDESFKVREFIITKRLYWDNDLLSEVAGRREDYQTRLAANMARHSAWRVSELIKRTEDPSILREIAENDSLGLRLLALKRIGDEDFKQKILGEIALYPVYDYKTNDRFEAIENLADEDIRQKALADISVNAVNPSTRLYAARLLAELITNGKLREADLASMAKNNPASNVRLSALRKIQSPQMLADIALHAESRRMRYLAAERISDQEMNKQIYNNSEDNAVKNIALSKITDREFILNLFFGRPSEVKRARRLSPAMKPLERGCLLTKPDSALMEVLSNAQTEAAGRTLCVEHLYIALLLFYQESLLSEYCHEITIDVLPTLYLLQYALKHRESPYKPNANTDYYLNRAAELAVLANRRNRCEGTRAIEPRDLMQAIEKEPSPLIYRCSIYCKSEVHKCASRWNRLRWRDEWYCILKANPTQPDDVEDVARAFHQSKAWALKIPL